MTRKPAVVSILLLFAAASFGQVDTGAISGIVRDHAGALRLATNGDGLYVSPPLPAGLYRVEVGLAGFRSAAKEFRLSIGEHPAVDFVLELGTVNESVVVQAVAPALQTETTTLSTVRSEEEIKTLQRTERQIQLALKILF